MKKNYTDNCAEDFEDYARLLQNQDLRWIGVDFDNVIARSIWPKSGIGEPMPGVKKSIKALIKKGYKIVVWTARPWSDYENVERWCKDNGIEVRRIICGKPLVRWLIDDRNIEFNPKKADAWEKALKKIK